MTKMTKMCQRFAIKESFQRQGEKANRCRVRSLAIKIYSRKTNLETRFLLPPFSGGGARRAGGRRLLLSGRGRRARALDVLGRARLAPRLYAASGGRVVERPGQGVAARGGRRIYLERQQRVRAR